MKTYCVSCKKNTASKNSSVRKTKQNWLMVLLFAVKKNQGSLKIKDSIKLYSTILMIFEWISLKWIKPLINLSTGENFMPEVHLRLPGFTL